MKTILLAFVLLSVTCYSQQKKDSKIIVTATDTANLFNRVALALYQQGYTMETKDESVGFLKTKEKLMDKHSAKQTISALVHDGQITFTSQFNTLGWWVDVVYSGEKKNAFTDAWFDVVTLGKRFGTVRYSK